MAFSTPPHTLLLMRKSSEFASNVMALLDSAGSRNARKTAAQPAAGQCRGRQPETRRAAGSWINPRARAAANSTTPIWLSRIISIDNVVEASIAKAV